MHLGAGAGQGPLHRVGEGVGMRAVLGQYGDGVRLAGVAGEGGGLGVGEPGNGARGAGASGAIRGCGLGDACDAEVSLPGGGLQRDGVADMGLRGACGAGVEYDLARAWRGAVGQRGAGESVRAPAP
ncbi:hypothetical protein GCM10009837_69310 [Streptomyces durmitorensis]